MKKPFLALILLCSATLSFSQMRMALLGGPLSAFVNETNSLPGWETSVKPDYTKRAGLHLGVLVDVPIKSNFSFQTGLLYMAKGRKYFMNNDTLSSIISDTISSSSNLSVSYIEAPLNIAYRVPMGKKANFLLSAGPYISFFYNGKQSTQTRIYSTNSFKSSEQKLESGNGTGKIRSIDLGWNARAGFELGNLLLTGFLSQGLTSFYQASYDGTFKHKVVGASLGIWLNKLVKPVAPKPVQVPGQPPAKSVFRDTDGDGISDAADRCPTQAGPPEFNGCPIPDTDGDGLIDTEDSCPTDAGPTANHGCPVLKQDTTIREVEKKVNFAAKNIFFNAYSDQLTLESQEPLEHIVDLLNSKPQAMITIEGHTDATGKKQDNKLLSQKRAETVKNYLVSNGIDETRIKAIGYGSDNPVASDKTPEGRAKNRRVELKLVQ